MRKYNSVFKTAFISEVGSELNNNDYFGFVELDDFACYVIADGITGIRDAHSAKEAIESIINAFQEAPSLSARSIKRYLKKANQELLNRKSYDKLKASVTVLVTNYEKMRYGHAGNTRFCLYRDGKRLHTSVDMSYSQTLVRQDKIPKDKVAVHEERNNLLCYLGQKNFKPFVSKKIKLSNSDILTLYTRGIWENIDDGELDDVFSQASNEPSQECDNVEDLLLSRQPEKLENYTFCAIYADKIFTDPKRRQRIKKTIIIILVIVILLLILGLIFYLTDRKKKQRIEDMNLYYKSAMSYTEDENFIRANEECGKALELAEKLRDKEMRERLTNYQIALAAVNTAEDHYADKKYDTALQSFVNAKNRSRYADNLAEMYIDERIERLNNYMLVFDSITLGDRLLELESFEMAEQKYLEAKKAASKIYFEEGKTDALDSLEKLYAKWEENLAKEKEKQSDEASSQVAAAQLMASGDKSFGEMDYDSAMVYYLSALEKYTKIEDQASIAVLNKKIIALNDKQEDIEERVNDARFFEEQARLYLEEKNYAESKIQYQYALQIYQELKNDSKVTEIQGVIDIMSSKDEQAKAEEEKENRKNSNESADGAATVSGNETAQ